MLLSYVLFPAYFFPNSWDQCSKTTFLISGHPLMHLIHAILLFFFNFYFDGFFFDGVNFCSFFQFLGVGVSVEELQLLGISYYLLIKVNFLSPVFFLHGYNSRSKFFDLHVICWIIVQWVIIVLNLDPVVVGFCQFEFFCKFWTTEIQVNVCFVISIIFNTVYSSYLNTQKVKLMFCRSVSSFLLQFMPIFKFINCFLPLVFSCQIKV